MMTSHDHEERCRQIKISIADSQAQTAKIKTQSRMWMVAGSTLPIVALVMFALKLL